MLTLLVHRTHFGNSLNNSISLGSEAADYSRASLLPLLYQFELWPLDPSPSSVFSIVFLPLSPFPHFSVSASQEFDQKPTVSPEALAYGAARQSRDWGVGGGFKLSQGREAGCRHSGSHTRPAGLTSYSCCLSSLLLSSGFLWAYAVYWAFDPLAQEMIQGSDFSMN